MTTLGKSMVTQAVEKLDRELKTFTGSNYENAVKNGVAAALKEFANQDDEFAQAIAQSDKTLSDCCKQIVKGAGASLSDHEAYCRAVRFYFPGADVKFQMVVELNPEHEQAAQPARTSSKVIELSDFFK